MSSPEVFQHYSVLRREDGSLYELGRGAMGITYKAFDVNLRCNVALKVINAAFLNSEQAKQRFLREARAAAQLRHRNVAAVFHLGVDPTAFFYAMEFIDGETVDALVKRDGPLPVRTALRYTGHVARALLAAKKQGLIHRDIKPANLMVVHEEGEDEPIIKVIDFGLAKPSLQDQGSSAAITVSGIVGTPHYISPEQADERQLDSRSDIYALGVTLWHMVTGTLPFTGSLGSVISQHLMTPPPLEKLAGLPEGVIKLIARMLEKDPANRPQGPDELLKELKALMAELRGEPALAREAAGGETGVAALSTQAPATTEIGTKVTPIPGMIIGERFQLGELLGEGSSSAVFRAQDLQLNRTIRAKIVRPGLTIGQAELKKLQEKIAATSRAPHPNILQPYSFEAPKDVALLSAEYANGFSLQQVLRHWRRLSLPETLELGEQLADAADHACEQRLDGFQMELRKSLVHFPEASAEPARRYLETEVQNWPSFLVKLDALNLAQFVGGSNSLGMSRTVVQSSGTVDMGSPEDSAVICAENSVRAVGAVVYELVHGAPPKYINFPAEETDKYTPLGVLSEGENEVLRLGLSAAPPFENARALVAALAQGSVGDLEQAQRRLRTRTGRRLRPRTGGSESEPGISRAGRSATGRGGSGSGAPEDESGAGDCCPPIPTPADTATPAPVVLEGSAAREIYSKVLGVPVPSSEEAEQAARALEAPPPPGAGEPPAAELPSAEAPAADSSPAHSTDEYNPPEEELTVRDMPIGALRHLRSLPEAQLCQDGPPGRVRSPFDPEREVSIAPQNWVPGALLECETTQQNYRLPAELPPLWGGTEAEHPGYIRSPFTGELQGVPYESWQPFQPVQCAQTGQTFILPATLPEWLPEAVWVARKPGAVLSPYEGGGELELTAEQWQPRAVLTCPGTGNRFVLPAIEPFPAYSLEKEAVICAMARPHEDERSAAAKLAQPGREVSAEIVRSIWERHHLATPGERETARNERLQRRTGRIVAQPSNSLFATASSMGVQPAARSIAAPPPAVPAVDTAPTMGPTAKGKTLLLAGAAVLVILIVAIVAVFWPSGAAPVGAFVLAAGPQFPPSSRVDLVTDKGTHTGTARMLDSKLIQVDLPPELRGSTPPRLKVVAPGYEPVECTLKANSQGEISAQQRTPWTRKTSKLTVKQPPGGVDYDKITAIWVRPLDDEPGAAPPPEGIELPLGKSAAVGDVPTGIYNLQLSSADPARVKPYILATEKPISAVAPALVTVPRSIAGSYWGLWTADASAEGYPGTFLIFEITPTAKLVTVKEIEIKRGALGEEREFRHLDQKPLAGAINRMNNAVLEAPRTLSLVCPIWDCEFDISLRFNENLTEAKLTVQTARPKSAEEIEAMRQKMLKHLEEQVRGGVNPSIFRYEDAQRYAASPKLESLARYGRLADPARYGAFYNALFKSLAELTQEKPGGISVFYPVETILFPNPPNAAGWEATPSRPSFRK